jgi:hypothetical protein
MRTLKIKIDTAMFSSDSGFGGALYYDETNDSYIFANKGTEDIIKDGGADATQALGMKTAQYEEAVLVADMLDKKLSSNVSFTGHSLGGGLASAQALRVDSTANTFNAAGLHRDTMERLKIDGKDTSSINAYHISGEPLSATQDSLAVDAAAFYFTPHKNAAELGTEMGSWISGKEHDANFGIAYTPEAIGNRIEIPAVAISESPEGSINYNNKLEGIDKVTSTLDLHGSAYVVGSMQYISDKSGQ